MAGAAYLCWLGWQALRAAGRETRIAATAATGTDTTPLAVHLRRGFIANAINPKVALFFLAFLPQFIATGSPYAMAQSVILGMLFAVQTMLVFGLIGWFAGHIGGWLRRSEGADRLMNRATGLLFIGLGLRLAAETH
jgi:threonine/homoserine/homoserine lactone efflux protein